MKAELDKEWNLIKKRLLNSETIEKLEETLDFHDIRTFNHGKITYNEYDIPQEMVSFFKDPKHKQVPKYFFTGLFQWKQKEDNEIFSKQIILFSNYHNSACLFDSYKD